MLKMFSELGLKNENSSKYYCKIAKIEMLK